MAMIYLDNAATTPPNAAAVEEVLRLLGEEFHNPSALYRASFAAHKRMEEARRAILSCIADPAKFALEFTSCGSESDNQALFSGARRGNFVTTQGEHAAVQRTAEELSRRGVEARFAKLDRFGRVDAEDLLRLVDERTSLVSVIHVNNETGAVNDVASLAAAVKKKCLRALFHSDGVQAFGKIAFRLTKEIDLYTVSAHKIGGVRGVGALFYRKGAPLHPLIFGGGQESGLRGGTENTFAIAQFAAAAGRKFVSLAADAERAARLRGLLLEGLDADIFSALSPQDGSPYILSVSARGLRAEVLLHMLDDNGVMVGTGSACSSKNRYSRVILACGLDERTADGVLRLSLSSETTEEECRRAIEIINRCARELRERMR